MTVLISVVCALEIPLCLTVKYLCDDSHDFVSHTLARDLLYIYV